MRKYRILYVEDNKTDFDMVKAVLEEYDLLEVIYRVEKREEFLIALEENDIDIILTDYSLPVFHGIEVLQLTAEKFPYIPLIMVTGNLSDEIAVDMIKKGAWDYVLKENVYRLIPAIQSCMARRRIKIEKDQALKTLNESEAAYRSLSETSPYGIFVHVRGRVFYHNQEAVRIIFGKEEGSFVGEKIEDYVHPAYMKNLKARMKKLYLGKKVDAVTEMKFFNAEGKELILEIASSPIIFKGHPAGQVIFKDIAARKRSERELIKAKEKAEESDRLKTAFLENLSHEIRTPLNGIIGFTSLLKIRDITEEDQNKYIDIIEESGLHLLSIIDDLIDVSRIETKQFELRYEEVDLHKMLDDVYMFYNNDERYKKTQIFLNLTRPEFSEDVWIYTDKSRLRQVFMNLLNNAFKFTEEGVIEFGYEPVAKNEYLFFVKDSGVGIPDWARELVFERFRQADNSRRRAVEGNGLGLTISRGIVHAMGGEIWFDSEPGRGTEFYFKVLFDKQPVKIEKESFINR